MSQTLSLCFDGKKDTERIEKQENAATSNLILCEVAWVLEDMGKQGEARNALKKLISYRDRERGKFIMEATNMPAKRMDYNDGVNLAVMMREGISEAYTNDTKHPGGVDFLKPIFE